MTADFIVSVVLAGASLGLLLLLPFTGGD